MSISIRSVTFGLDISTIDRRTICSQINKCLNDMITVYNNISCIVRTHRITVNPMNELNTFNEESVAAVIDLINNIAKDIDVRWFCIPFNFINKIDPEIDKIVLDVAKKYKNSFINLMVADQTSISLEGIYRATNIVKKIAFLSNNGYDNFRVGLSCNCNPNTPFFPFSYHKGGHGFSLAIELVSKIQKIVQANLRKSLISIRELIIDELVPQLKKIDAISNEIALRNNLEYYGMDLSLAPFPDDDNNSVSYLVELLGADNFGGNGTTFITAYLTDIIRAVIKQADLKAVGFNGVMYSLLEDRHLARRNNQRLFTIDSLIHYSSVCGCGLDMVPLPGNVYVEEIASIALDVATLAVNLKKPLGVRVLPIPLKSGGELTDFNYDFLVNTRIKDIKNSTYNFHDSLNCNESAFSYVTSRFI